MDLTTEQERTEWAASAHSILTGERWLSTDRVMLANAVEALLRENAELATERDRAIAHDRQDYPTADAYGKVCAALANNKTALTFAHRRIEELRAGISSAAVFAAMNDGSQIMKVLNRTLIVDNDALAKEQK